ncbi:MAG: hypothetical protein K1W06_11500 [Lachnospiraceae bacterium]
MFGKKVKNEKPVVVTTKEELKAAIKSKEPCIEVQGNLAKKMKWMTKLSPKLIIILLPLLAASTVPGAAAFTMPAAAAAAATTSGIAVSEIVVIVVALSANTMLAIIKGYNIKIKNAKGDELSLDKK